MFEGELTFCTSINSQPYIMIMRLSTADGADANSRIFVFSPFLVQARFRQCVIWRDGSPIGYARPELSQGAQQGGGAANSKAGVLLCV